MKKNKSCQTCSFYITDEDISHLSKEEQIEFENFDPTTLDSIEEDQLKRLAFLLQKLRRQTCIGGLIHFNETKEHCKYHKNLPTDFDKSQLLQVFINNTAKFQSKKSHLISISFGIITLIVSIYGLYQNSENKVLKAQIVDLKQDAENMTKTINLLQDSISTLNDSIQ